MKSIFARNLMKTAALILVVVACVSMLHAADLKQDLSSADLVLLEGKIITVDAKDSIAEAVAMRHGRIAAVGQSKDIEQLIGPQTQVIRLGGKTVLPGLIDAHTHLEGIAAFHRMLDVHVPPLKGNEEILQKVKERVSQAKPGEWIIGAGGWASRCRAGRSWTKLRPRLRWFCEKAHTFRS